MIAYVDASAVLRMVLGQPDRLAGWDEIKRAVSSELLQVECLRTLDRLRLAGHLGDDRLIACRGAVHDLLRGIDQVEITSRVLSRAAQPFSVPLGTLDAIHLATALLWKEGRDAELVLATHDRQLARAGRACGVRTVGVDRGR